MADDQRPVRAVRTDLRPARPRGCGSQVPHIPPQWARHSGGNRGGFCLRRPGAVAISERRPPACSCLVRAALHAGHARSGPARRRHRSEVHPPQRETVLVADRADEPAGDAGAYGGIRRGREPRPNGHDRHRSGRPRRQARSSHARPVRGRAVTRRVRSAQDP